MKKGCLIVSTLLLCSGILVLVMLRVAFGDKTVLEQHLDDSCTIQIRTKGWWEICVPVYLKISQKGRKTLTSAPFSCYQPEDIESKELRLEIRKVDNIIVIYYQEDANEILAMVSLEDDLVYPFKQSGDHEEITLYYVKVRKLFSQLKILLKNENLKLSGLRREK